MPSLRLRLLDAFEVAIDDQPITKLYSDRTRALLAYLAIEADRPHRRGELAMLLWPDVEAKKASQNLRQTLRQLQLAIGNKEADPPYLLITRQTVQFNVAADQWCDVAAVRGGDVMTYRGGLLAQLYLPDNDLFNDWATIQREALHREVLGKLRELGREAFDLDNLPQAIIYAQKQVEIDPWREEAYQDWMRFLIADGQSAEAQRVYEKCKQTLWDELSIEPSAETKSILNAEIREKTAASFILHPSSLPEDKTPFIGRSQEIADIKSLLMEPDCQLLTLVGLGGAGKTRLALTVARQLFEQTYRDGVWFVSLVGAEVMLPNIVRVLKLTTPSDLNTALHSFLADKHLLIVLDNCEELLHEGAWLEQLLTNAPNVQVLATSRQSFDSASEWVFAVEGLRTGGTEQLSDAEELFFAAAQRANARFRPKSADRPLIQQICERVLGHPLSIELAASWVRLLDVGQISAEIDKNLTIFATQSRQFEQRHRNLRAVFDYTWQTLTADEQETMSHLAVFHDGFTRNAAERVANANLLTLLQLVNKSLVQRRDDRFGLHEAVRQYAESRSMALPHAAHAAYYVERLHALEKRLKTRLEPEPIEAISADLENVRAAWSWATAQQPDLLQPALATLFIYWQRVGLIVEGGERCEKLAMAAIDIPLRVQVDNKRAEWLVMLNREAECRPILEAIIPLCQQHNLLREEALAHTTLAIYQFIQRDYERSVATYQRSLTLAEQSGDAAIEAECRGRFGRTLENIGRFEEAIDMLKSAVTIAEKIGRVDISTSIYERLSITYLNVGNRKEMTRYAKIYARAVERMAGEREIASANYLLGLSYDIREEPQNSLQHYRTALTIFERLNIERRIIVTAIHLAGAYTHIKEYDLAEQLYQMVLARVETEYAVSVYSLLSNLYIDMGDVGKAHQMLRESLKRISWTAPSSQSMQNFMAIAKGLIALDRPNAARPFIDYVLQSPLTRSIHRQMTTEMAATLPAAPDAKPYTLTQLRDLAEQEIM